MDRAALISGQMPGLERRVEDQWVVFMRGQYHPVSVRPVDGGHDVIYKGERFAVRSAWHFGEPLFRGTLNGVNICVQAERRYLEYRLFHSGSQVDVLILTPKQRNCTG